MAGASGFLVAFDVDAIKEYVFAPVRPKDIAGGSRVVEQFTREAAEWSGARCLYAGGGAGVLEVPTEAAAEALAAQLEQRFAELTDGGGSCTAVWERAGTSHSVTRSRLRQRLVRRKAERALDLATEDVVAAGARPCQACGREPGTVTSGVLDDDEERIGPQCVARRAALGRPDRRGSAVPPQAHTLEDLVSAPAGADDDGVEEPARRRPLAALYLDADRAGERLRTLGEREVRQFADDVSQVTGAALDGMVARRGLAGRYLAPVVGGDDLLVFLDARHAATAVGELWEALRPLESRWELTFSAGIALGPLRTPLRLLLDRVEEALRQAKRAPAVAAGPRVAVTTMLGGRLHDPGRLLFGGPVPRERWDGPASVGELVAALGPVAPAQRAGLVADLTQPSTELALLDLEYRVMVGQRDESGGAGLGRAVDVARRLAEALGVGLPEVMMGGLLAAETFEPWGSTARPAEHRSTAR